MCFDTCVVAVAFDRILEITGSHHYLRLMENEMLEKLRHPIGRFQKSDDFTKDQLLQWSRDIEELPMLLKNQVIAMSEDQMDSPYRPDGWTGRQVVHHVADSHINAYVRFKLSLTEDSPIIKPYQEAKWAELADSREPVHVSIKLLEALHARWYVLLRSMEEEDFQMTYTHPEYGNKWKLGTVLSLYAWHGRHHLGHLKILTT